MIRITNFTKITYFLNHPLALFKTKTEIIVQLCYI